jgi:hypothetical protein
MQLYVPPCRFEPSPEWLRMMEAVQGELEEAGGSGEQGQPLALLSAAAAPAPELDEQLAAQQHEGSAAPPWHLDAQQGQEIAVVADAAGAGDGRRS